MIVQCDRCQTRFRLPDTSVGARGAKARCSRCGNVFMIEKSEEEPRTVPPPPGYPGAGAPVATPTVTTPQPELPSTFGTDFGAVDSSLDPFAGAFHSGLSDGSPKTTRTSIPEFLSESLGSAGLSSTERPPSRVTEKSPLGAPGPTLAPGANQSGFGAPSRPSALPPPPAQGLGGFSPSSVRNLPQPTELPAFDSEQSSRAPTKVDPSSEFFDIPPPPSAPMVQMETPSFDGPAFGKTGQMPSMERSPGGSAFAPSRPGDLDAADFLDPPEWSTEERQTVRFPTDQLPDLDELPEPPDEDDGRLGSATFENAPAIESALESFADIQSHHTAPPPRSYESKLETARLDVGRIELKQTRDGRTVDLVEDDPAPAPLGPIKPWQVELAAIALAALIGVPIFFFGTGPDGWLTKQVSAPVEASHPDRVESLRPRDATAVSYTSSKGKALVVVSGEAQNDGLAPRRHIRVIASALRDGEVVATREAWLGAILTPAQVVRVDSEEDLEHETEKLFETLGHGPEGIAVAPGKTLGFQVVFVDPPAPSDELRFRVDLVSPAAPTAEATDAKKK